MSGPEGARSRARRAAVTEPAGSRATTINTRSAITFGLMLVVSLGGPAAAQTSGDLPLWFEQHRIQAHFENGIQDDLLLAHKSMPLVEMIR